jgi:hypothetical protein
MTGERREKDSCQNNLRLSVNILRVLYIKYIIIMLRMLLCMLSCNVYYYVYYYVMYIIMYIIMLCIVLLYYILHTKYYVGPWDGGERIPIPVRYRGW